MHKIVPFRLTHILPPHINPAARRKPCHEASKHNASDLSGRSRVKIQQPTTDSRQTTTPRKATITHLMYECAVLRHGRNQFHLQIEPARAGSALSSYTAASNMSYRDVPDTSETGRRRTTTWPA
ncbi:sorting nexin-1 isoform X1 [Anopheles sinensis]|uniref:Sorting nexin-1 isoform X1 n=1 Tax=Anopheles sinensis TaxID=74873 RepID=A0A084WQY2_ANOSI|nr:sorting nexin-1 isoform X1 [Anopheles sinensis]